MTYDVDNKLRYAQKTWYTSDGPQTVFTEYRYDALGRRVLARTRRHTPCTLSEWKCLSTIDRYVWDGDQLVAEFRDPGSNDQPEANLNASGTYGNFHGPVRYTHAGGIDEPLAVWGGSSGVYGVVPHLSWRGNYEAGSDIQTGALLENGSPPWVWPTRYKDINLAPEIRTPIPDPTRWLGSLIENQIDLNGLAYRRNRYYSPTTGRFTSEDPIGLAGGLNLYGFSEGDPVNLSDPFGLCPVPQLCAGLLGAAMGAAGRLLFNAIGDRPLGEGLAESMIAGAIAGLTFGAAAPEATAGFFARSAGASVGSIGAGVATTRVILEAGKQGKHILGHGNFIPGRSVFTHSDPQGLLDKFVGTGQRLRGVAGGPGSELVDFGQNIGRVMVDGRLTNTTQGIIHYSRRGAHIVPRIPQ